MNQVEPTRADEGSGRRGPLHLFPPGVSLSGVWMRTSVHRRSSYDFWCLWARAMVPQPPGVPNFRATLYTGAPHTHPSFPPAPDGVRSLLLFSLVRTSIMARVAIVGKCQPKDPTARPKCVHCPPTVLGVWPGGSPTTPHNISRCSDLSKPPIAARATAVT